MDLKRLEKTLLEINQFSQSEEGVTRLAYSKEERQAAEHFSYLCRQEGMTVRMDASGNVIARREGSNPDLPVVACGSHLDTVIQGGRYDGTLGVIAALEVIRSLNDKRIETKHPIEIIAFACEESSRFGVSTIGSKAMAGLLDKESVAELKDSEGKSISNVFSECSLNFSGIERSNRRNEEFKVFFELHIEQGPVLERQLKQIGIVIGIAAPTRFELKIKGQASHSGTTPMDYRKDALLGAAEIALQLEQAAKMEARNGTVATVGACEVKPGSMNVIPDLATMKIDIRGTSTDSKNRVIEKLFTSIKQVEEKRSVSIEYSELSNEHPINLDKEVIQSLTESCELKGYTYMHMTSGAGHDAMNMAILCPTGLIFVPSKNGLSHHPDEYTAIEQIGIGTDLLETAIIEWAGRMH
ncbi:N-carbamoyl-L-amino acid amidohydrolase [Terribacillus saccharophilus]|uniref:N-carbamoyl-L-amino acid amidohydrolase n=1 Tax=Terribacillus saccharophilus TaxID=361277 RepID=A0A075LJ40_9BACI|nr:Zn-dependent hydrolase [Terribacillus goriensis]AIF66136.1 N-carbamoyl-L-amino acid amidohydrolase [Terribacillus goriensis]